MPCSRTAEVSGRHGCSPCTSLVGGSSRHLNAFYLGAFGVEGKPYYYQLELPAAALQLGEAPGWEGALYI